jgi:RNA polymerase sigma factor (sigma-70 family)
VAQALATKSRAYLPSELNQFAGCFFLLVDINKWMDNASDMDLVRQYADRNSDTAFAALVSRHVNLVYSAALRKTGNPAAAEEITQAVFVILAKKAGRISNKTNLAGWLYQTARLAASSLLKSEARRVRREQEAYMQTELGAATPDETWTQLAPLLEDAMGELDEKERGAVVLRFFGSKSFAEMAQVAGISENAAQKRVTRALEKMHRYFSRHGVSSTTALIAASISANAVHAAPAMLAKSVTAVAATKGAAASTSTLTLINGALKIMAWTKAKTAIVVGVALIFSAAVVTPTVAHYYHRHGNPKTADEAVRAIFEDWGRGDWDGFYANFREPGVSRAMYDKVLNDKIKSELAGLQLVSVGQPSNSFGPDMWFVPCTIRRKDGQEQESRMHVAQNPFTKRWYYKGGP